MGRHHGRHARSQRGFTLIELMVVVVIIALLAAVALPSFFRESNKAKHETEVTAMFSELVVKLEQDKIETGAYRGIPMCPGTPIAAGYNFTTTCATGTDWEVLRVLPPSTTMYCSYQISVGTATDVPAPPAGFTMLAPSTTWWFLIAECDMSSNGGTNATYFQSSMDNKLQKQNVGA